MNNNLRLIVGLILICGHIHAHTIAPPTYNNPILPGYHPDPSICRVADEYYMVNSSFEWYPAMPIHKSKDLVNWELVGYGASDPAKLQICQGTRDSGGIFAVTIRYHDGLFYLITTMIGGKGNFYVTAEDPSGPWSEPTWLDAPGIDPSLFWDDDGRCYYIGHGNLSGKQAWPQQQGAWMQELDTEQGKLVGPRKQLTHGHASNAIWTEGPHLYKINGKYVLIVAEGGTEHNHAVTQFYSDELWGPYIPSQINPILTHRHLGMDSHIQCVGHADFVQTQNNEWWMVALGTRNFDGEKYLSRETFLVPMEIEDIYGEMNILVNRGYGRILEQQKRPDLPWTPVKTDPVRDEFASEELALKWNMLRSPSKKWYEIEAGKLILDLRPEIISEFVNPSLLAQRIRNRKFEASTKLVLQSEKRNEEAGLVLYRDTESNVTFLKQGSDIILSYRDGEQTETVYKTFVGNDELILSVESDGKFLKFSYETHGGEKVYIEKQLQLLIIGDKKGGQFNGPMIGVYASSNGKKSKNKAAFDWFEYNTLR